MAILFAFGGIQRRKGRRIMNANHPVLSLVSKTSQKPSWLSISAMKRRLEGSSE